MSTNSTFNGNIQDRESPINTSTFSEEQNSEGDPPEEQNVEENEEESPEEEKNDEEEEYPDGEKNEDEEASPTTEKLVEDYSEAPYNGSIEALKKETTKENLIESPADIFATGDIDDIW